MVGIGLLFLRLASVQRSTLSRLEFLIIALTLGMLIYSQILLFAGALGLFNQTLVMTLRIIGLLALAFALYAHKSRLIIPTVNNPAWLPEALVGLLCGFMIVSTYLSSSIHGDAQQYHLGFPWIMSLTGRLVWNETLLHSGTYLGYDLLYLSVADLAKLIDSPAMLDRLKLFNAITNTLFPVSVLLVCRAFGGSRTASAIAALMVFTLGAINDWGLLKNDIFAATIGLITLTILIRAYDQANERLLLIATALAAYAVSVKIPNAIPLAIPFTFVYLSRRFTLRVCIHSTTIGLVLLLPWAITAYIAQGNPFSPVAMPLPDEIKQAWIARNTNGIEASALNFVTMFIPIVLGLHPISGNQTLGVLGLAALVASLVILIKDASKRKTGLPEIITASALIWFVIFYASRYDNRFLSRYILISFATFFAFLSFKIESYLQIVSVRVRASIFLAFLTFLLIFIGENPSITERYKSLVRFQGSEQTAHEKKTIFSKYSEPYRTIERLRKPGEAVAINDHMTLFLKPPFFNLHAMHASSINLYQKDMDYVKRYLSERSVKFLLFRKGISGGTKAVDDYMANCAQEIQSFGKSLTLYAVKSNCQ